MKTLVDEEMFAAVSELYPVAVTSELLNKCRKSSALAAQFLPSAMELEREEYELDDPIGDQSHSPLPGLIHRYPDRVLLLPRGNCPSYCRFCFRKQFVGKSVNLSQRQLSLALDYIRIHQEVREVILSGGEPLTLHASELEKLLKEVATIEHVDSIRIHSRLPVTAPALAKCFPAEVFSELSKPLYLVIHCNHADEIDETMIDFTKRLRRQGLILLSQTVLLKGVNDSADVLEELFRKLVRTGTRPYYLHHLDRAPGTSHFRVSLSRGRELMASLRGRVSGIALPTYILDLPGGEGKIPAESEWLIEKDSGLYHAISPCHKQETIYIG